MIPGSTHFPSASMDVPPVGNERSGPTWVMMPSSATIPPGTRPVGVTTMPFLITVCMVFSFRLLVLSTMPFGQQFAVQFHEVVLVLHGFVVYRVSRRLPERRHDLHGDHVKHAGDNHDRERPYQRDADNLRPGKQVADKAHADRHRVDAVPVPIRTGVGAVD